MQSFIEKQQSYNYTNLNSRKYPPKHSCDLSAKKEKLNITNQQLNEMAMKGEINKNNNNIFNGKNLSDNTKITSFYALKSAPVYQSPLLYFG